MEAIMNRIAELNKIILESHKDSSVDSAIIWMNAVKERGELQDSLRSQNINVHVNVNR